jgi:spermidine/putrescine-binding protein
MGVKVQYVIGNPAENLAKLIAARGREVPFDVMESSPELMQTLIKGGFVQKINLTNVPNAKGLPAFAVSDFYVVTTVDQNGILYNESKFRELGIPKPEKYGDLINPKLEGHVGFPDVTISPHWSAIVGLAYEAGGDEAKLEKAVEQVGRIKPLYYYPSSAEMATKFSLGDVWAAPSHAGWYIRIRRSGVPIGFSHPRIGNKYGAVESLSKNIVKGTRNLAAAEAYINIWLDPEVQFQFAKQTGVIPINSVARRRLMTDPDAGPILLLSDEQLNNAFLIDWQKLDPDGWRGTWNRSIKR